MFMSIFFLIQDKLQYFEWVFFPKNCTKTFKLLHVIWLYQISFRHIIWDLHIVFLTT